MKRFNLEPFTEKSSEVVTSEINACIFFPDGADDQHLNDFMPEEGLCRARRKRPSLNYTRYRIPKHVHASAGVQTSYKPFYRKQHMLDGIIEGRSW